MKIEHIFFDLDRTLWDFEANSDIALRQLFVEFELDKKIESIEVFIQSYKKINDKYWDDYRLEKVSKENLRTGRFYDTLLEFYIDNIELATNFGIKYLEVCPELTHLFPGTIEMLSNLKNQGKKLHIITNGFSESQYKKLNNSGLIDFFDVIVCSDELGINKPDKRIFLEALKQAKAQAKESIMVGDHPEIDILGAIAVGMRGILFDPLNHYPNTSLERITELEQLPLILLGIKV